MNALIEQLKQSEQDFEFYPTTNEIIAALVRDMRFAGESNWMVREKAQGVLDIGAGNGKVLMAIKQQWKDVPLYAIEKSQVLCEQLDPSIFIVGTEFHEQSLVSKSIGMTFCNPPYSEFEDWSVKIIRESASQFVYLVIPVRWKLSVPIREAMKYREANVKVLGTFSFMDAEDRAARAEVNLLRIDMKRYDADDAFDRFFDEQFAELREKFRSSYEPEAEVDGRSGSFASLVVGQNYPERLVELYDIEMDHVRKNYDMVGKLDVELLKEFQVEPKRILGCLKERLKGMRNKYWNELFSRMEQVTDRLCASERKTMLNTLQRNGHVDFTLSNIHAVIIWVLKNANQHLDSQLIKTFERMVEKANVKNYASNKRVFTYDHWRYNEEKPSHIALEYRIVLERVGGFSNCSYDRGLTESGCEFLGDILRVARNLGFISKTNDPRLIRRRGSEGWEAGKLETFTYTTKNGQAPLIEVRAYANGNIHIRMDQDFSLALNVEYGRLKGWLRSGEEAARELAAIDAAKDAPAKKSAEAQATKAQKYFNSQIKLGKSSLLMLAAPSEELALGI